MTRNRARNVRTDFSRSDPIHELQRLKRLTCDDSYLFNSPDDDEPAFENVEVVQDPMLNEQLQFDVNRIEVVFNFAAVGGEEAFIDRRLCVQKRRVELEDRRLRLARQLEDIDATLLAIEKYTEQLDA